MKKVNIISVLLMLIICIGVLSGCNAEKQQHDKSPSEKLYSYADTKIGRASGVRAIVGLVNETQYEIKDIALQTNKEPYGLTVNFKVDSRADHRYIDENGLNKMSALIFALVDNADEIKYEFFDDYSNDDGFIGYYYTRQNLCERIKSELITVDYIKTSTESQEAFDDFYTAVMATEVAVQKSEYQDKLYDFIGEDCEIALNSSFDADISIGDLTNEEIDNLSNVFSTPVGKYTGAGITAHLMVCEIRNFKTNEIKNCAFMYYTHADEGFIDIGTTYLDEQQYDIVREIIVNRQN